MWPWGPQLTDPGHTSSPNLDTSRADNKAWALEGQPGAKDGKAGPKKIVEAGAGAGHRRRGRGRKGRGEGGLV